RVAPLLEVFGGDKDDLGVGILGQVEQQLGGVLVGAGEDADERDPLGGRAVLQGGHGAGELVEHAPGDAAAEAGGGDDVAAAAAGFGVGVVGGGAFQFRPGGATGGPQSRRSLVTDGGIVMAEVFDPSAVLPAPVQHGSQDRYGEHRPH